MFEGEAYASYIALCRSLRLEREWWQEGDWYISAVTGRVELAWASAHLTRTGQIWLPRQDQLVLMLREAGGLRNLRLYFPATVEDEFVAKAYFSDDRTIEARAGDSAEEALLECWMAVTGRSVDG